jgi:transcriptional regulator with XRE-family HTH domain
MRAKQRHAVLVCYNDESIAMDTGSPITLRSKKLGVLIRDARLAARRTPDECARAMGVTRGLFRAYEEGRRAPSLPELEILAYYLRLPIDHFWGRAALSDAPDRQDDLDLPQLVQIRQRMIGARLRQERNHASLSVRALSDQTGIPPARINSFELGERPIPLPELETLLEALSARIDTFFDQGGPIGKWMTSQKSMKQFLELPGDLQAFVCQPVNRPYLDIAVKLSAMSSEKLRSVAEGLLDITL